MNSDWSVIWPGDGEDKTIALVKLFAMVTLSLKVTWYALRWLPSKVNPIVPFTTSPPTNRNIAQIFSSKRVFFLSLHFDRHLRQPKSAELWECEGEERWADPAAGGRMAPERTEPAAVATVCLHASGSPHKSIKISTTPGTLKLVTFINSYKWNGCQLPTTSDVVLKRYVYRNTRLPHWDSCRANSHINWEIMIRKCTFG